jgi:hypothetical protein
MTPIFTGTIQSGKLTLDKGQQFREYLHTLEGKRIELTVERLTHKRTNNQNKYYWGVVVAEIAKHTGHDPEQVHELLKQKFSPKWRLMEKNNTNGMITEFSDIPTSTTHLDTIAFVEYTEKCRMWANEFLGLQIPLPGEVTV